MKTIVAISATLLLLVASALSQDYKVVHSFGSSAAGSSRAAFVSNAGSFYRMEPSGSCCGGNLLNWITPPKTGAIWTSYDETFNPSTGSGPSGLITDAQGNLYGTFSSGPVTKDVGSGDGYVFETSPGKANSKGLATPLYVFTGGPDGGYPLGGVVFDAQGNLYGTTLMGGAYGYGTVFKLSPSSAGWTETVLHSFNLDGVDGAYPESTLILDATGNLYGTTTQGGPTSVCGNSLCSSGTVFQVTPDGVESVLYAFTTNTNGLQDGQGPNGSLVFDALGNLYGTTAGGGTNLCYWGPGNPQIACGTVFELSPGAGGVWTEQIIHEFNGTKGAVPLSGVIFDAFGNLYGSTWLGGTYYGNVFPDYGTVFKLSRTAAGGWAETVLHNFVFNGEDGYSAQGQTILSANKILGTTQSGGTSTACGSINGMPSGCGTVFEITLNTTQTTLTSSLNPSNFGQSVTFTAKVTSLLQITPTGTVNFYDSATETNLGSSSLNGSGVAILQTAALGPSTHTIVATYNGDASLTSSASPILTQVVLGAAAKYSPTSLSYGNQTVGMSSSPQSISLMNTGDIPLSFTSVTFTGADPTNFVQTNNCGTSLAGGATCTFLVTFTPTAAGTRSAALTLSDNAPSKLQKIPVSGVGVLPAVTFSLTSLTFPTQVIYTTSKAQTVTLTNSGLGILNITNIAASAQFSQTNNCGSTLAPAGTCTLTVKFQPTSLATITGSISVTDNAAASPQALPLIGVGTAIQLTPVGLSFGNQPVGTKSLAKTVTVSNKSHQTINISRIAIRGADTSDFPFISTTCGSSLASGASCFVKVAFMPTATGKRTAWVAISDDGGGEVQRAGLAGTGT